MRMHAVALLAVAMLLGTAAAETTIVVGDCANGEYHYSTLFQALQEAQRHYDVNVVVCGEANIGAYTSVKTGRITIYGGTIWSNDDVLNIDADSVRLENVRFVNTLVIARSREDVRIDDVNAEGDGHYNYCIDVNAGGNVTVNGLNVSGCDYGIHIRGASELNLWKITAGKNTVAVLVAGKDVRGNILINPVERIVEKTIVKTVEKNVPVPVTKYVVPPELAEKIQACERNVKALVAQKKVLEEKLSETEAKLPVNEQAGGGAWENSLAVAVAGLAVGYLLGRI